MIKYDVDYYYNLLRIHTDSARNICDIRWKFLSLITDRSEYKFGSSIKILDYGCGPGWFAALKPDFIDNDCMDTFDIMPVPQTGIRHKHYDIITLWDVLEHIPDFTELVSLFENTHYIAIAIPIKPEATQWDKWKHFKPGEHLHYYTIDLLQALFELYGFSLLKDAMPECPPRKDIHSLIFEKINKNNRGK